MFHLTTIGYPVWVVIPHPPESSSCGEEVSMSARFQAFLVVLGMLALAALNASSPWGP